jgi:hypothetical protein
MTNAKPEIDLTGAVCPAPPAANRKAVAVAATADLIDLAVKAGGFIGGWAATATVTDSTLPKLIGGVVGMTAAGLAYTAVTSWFGKDTA